MKHIDDTKLPELVAELSRRAMPGGDFGQLFDELDDPVIAELARHVIRMQKLLLTDVKVRAAMQRMRERRSYPHTDN